jgi:cell division protein FtsA
MQGGAYAIKGKKGSVAVLDIGTSKIVCFIAEPNSAGELQIVGVGHQLARGIRSGMITDTAEAEHSIRNAVHHAEQMAGQQIENIAVNISGTQLASLRVNVELTVSGDGVNEQDIADILREGCDHVREKGRTIIHCFAMQYHLDGAKGIRDPRNMFGSTLGANLHIVTADDAQIRNIIGCIQRCHLNVVDFIVSSHASGLGCLEPDEMDLGVTLVDMGGWETTVSVFSGGKNIYCDVIPVGGQHITSDIAAGLGTPMSHAERIKNLYGSVMPAPKDDQTLVDVPQFGEDEELGEYNKVPKSALVGIIRPRVEEVLELVRDRLERSGVPAQMVRNIVLTGGASQLVGLRECASRMLSSQGRIQVRIGKPKFVQGLVDSVSGPSFSCAVGMLRFLAMRPMEDSYFDVTRKSSGVARRSQRVLQWIKESF